MFGVYSLMFVSLLYQITLTTKNLSIMRIKLNPYALLMPVILLAGYLLYTYIKVYGIY